MTLTVLATICFLACTFYLYVLFQWMRDTKGRNTTRPAMDNEAGEKSEKKRPHIVDSRGLQKDRTTKNLLQWPASLEIAC